MAITMALLRFNYNRGQKSWDKFTFVALFHTRQTNSQARIHLYLFSPPSPPPYNVGNVYTLFLQSFNIVLGGGGGGEATHFETDNSAFFKIPF